MTPCPYNAAQRKADEADEETVRSPAAVIQIFHAIFLFLQLGYRPFHTDARF